MEYNFREIEKKWQQWWEEHEVYKVSNHSDKPKYYVLDMFPYPSGAGLHVGHPLGYIASDIYARYKRLKGFNVLHPMGYDAFGLPAEQYAIEHGIHPAISTKQNIENFRKQLDKIGFCFDWSRQVNTSEPQYYKWTQWIFLQLFKSFYNRTTKRAESIESLVEIFEEEGNKNHPVPNSQFQLSVNGKQSAVNGNSSLFTAHQWKDFDKATQQAILMEYRLAYCGYGEVNWCEALGTVLANDEVINGVSERGGYPVIKKKLRQWYLRITEYADRLLEGLQKVDFSEAMKEMQTNWIGKSYGAEIDFAIADTGATLKVFTTRPDTIFGVDFMVIAPEHELINSITSTEQKQAVEEYITYVKSRSDRERQAEKKITGVFTGAHAINPFNQKQIPVWISEYVLAGYGTGAIMGVPCGDERDFNFAKNFNINITNILGDKFNGKEANATKDAILENSDFLNGIVMRDAIHIVNEKLASLGIGKAKVNYKMRDAAFSRQRYWGEPFPIVWRDGIAYPLDESELPLELPYMEDIKPGKDGEGPLSNNKEWSLIPSPSPLVEKGASVQEVKQNGITGAKYSVYTPMQYELAKEMRKNHTEAEDKLWQQLRSNKLEVKFRRQHPIDAYIVDFIALQNKLIVEVDGGYHENEKQKKYDENRTQVLKEIGFTVVRFTNEEVISNEADVLKKIKQELQKNSLQQKEVGSLQTPLSTSGEGLGVRESSTMPGYAGSSWYFLRYMDPQNNETFCDKKVSDYWNQVDVYVGGTEHAVGHLLYSRMWTKFLYDLNLISFNEPYKKLLNQGMITGISQLIYRDLIKGNQTLYHSTQPKSFGDKLLTHYVSSDMILQNADKLAKTHIPIKYVDSNKLNLDSFYDNPIFDKDGIFYTKDGYYVDGEWFDYSHKKLEKKGIFFTISEVEKMSKSKLNVENPDDIINKYGADTFRMYEMFLGPVEQSKPWDTKGIEGVHRFLRKLWRLFYPEGAEAPLSIHGEGSGVRATEAELKILHKTIKKIEEDTERFSYNTAVSAFMVCVNELSDLKCSKKEILEPLVIMLSSYAPHIAEELYLTLTLSTSGEGTHRSVLDAAYPVLNEKYLVESTKEYPISINGKLRTTLNMALDAEQKQVEETVLQNDVVQKWLDGKSPKKIIFVKGKMVNVVI